MLRGSAAVLVLACACGETPSGAPDSGVDPDATADPAPLVVVTINLRCLIDDWEARLPLLADGLAAAAPDVVGVQEVCAEPGGRDALEVLLGALADRGVGDLVAVRTTTHVAWDTYDEGLAIVSRWPITAMRVEALPPGALPRKVLAARVDAPGREVVLATTHLDHLDEATRAAQATAAAAMVDAFADGPAILVGDLNEDPGGGVSRALEDAGLVDAWAALSADAGFTFPSSAPEIRIDYVWLGGLAPTTIERVFVDPAGATYASDHLGLRATVD